MLWKVLERLAIYASTILRNCNFSFRFQTEEHTYRMEVYTGYIGSVNSDGNVVFAMYGDDEKKKEYPLISLKDTFRSGT